MGDTAAGEEDEFPWGVALDESDGEEAVFDEAKDGFNDAEMAACIKVMKALHGREDLYAGPACKPLRAVLQDIISRETGRLYCGKSREAYNAERADVMDTQARRRRQAQLDRKYINSKQLRASRIAALNKLTSAPSSEQPAITRGVPDGPAVADVTLPITADGESPSEAAAGLQQLLRSCYTCKTRYSELHFFYDSLCPTCAALNFSKRTQTAELSGRVAVVTGGRVKIGKQISLKLLRAGATVVITTRFPQNAAERMAQEADYGDWKDRVRYYGMDLRDLGSVERFCNWIADTFDRLDIIVNNACQTIRRPPAFYRHLIDKEVNPPVEFPQVVTTEGSLQRGAGPQAISDGTPAPGPADALAAALSQMVLVEGDEQQDKELFPENSVDVHGQQLDLREKHTWLLKLGEVPTVEAAEVFAVNSLAPFVLNGKLKPVMMRTQGVDKYIVNVSAMEGKFYRYKTPNHPHTNMAKAALNMMTRTSGDDFAKDGIIMNAVDTGWINDENPVQRAERIAKEQNFQTPIDEVDAAARVLDPVFRGVNDGERDCGKFYKDYNESEW